MTSIVVECLADIKHVIASTWPPQLISEASSSTNVTNCVSVKNLRRNRRWQG